jgi:hypothetical protein
MITEEDIEEAVWNSVCDSVIWYSIRAASVWDFVGSSVEDSVGDSVRDSVRSSIRDSVKQELNEKSL